MIVAGLVALVSAVQAGFATMGVTAVVDFGWRARYRQDNQGPGGASRVVFIPGKVPPDGNAPPKSIDAGELTPPRITSDNPRPLLWWHAITTLSVWGFDATQPTSELAQYAATVALWEQTVQAMHNAVYVDSQGVRHTVGLHDITWQQPQFVAPPVERGFGRELLVYFLHNGPIFDAVRGVATPKPGINRGTVT